MKLSTRLLTPLLATVLVVMSAYGFWALNQREETLLAEAQRETRAYATALGLAVERAGRDPESGDVEDIMDRVGREPAIYGVLVYDSAGGVAFASDPLPPTDPSPAETLRQVRAGGPTTLTREIDGLPVVASLRPLTDDGGRFVGVLEVAQPLASVVAERRRIRQRFFLNTLTLVAAVGITVVWLVRRHVSLPLDRFVHGVRALAGGDLSYRLPPAAAAGELGEVAEELNRMADRLQRAREELVAEGEERVALERRLRQTESLAEAGRLAAGLAHEIGAPLHVIRGRAQLLLDTGLDGATDRNLRIVISQIDRIAHIVRNLLGYARARELRPVETDLRASAEGVVEFVEDEARRTGVDLVLAVPARPVPVEGDPDQLQQVVLNLVMNGLQAAASTSDEGRVRVTVSMAERGGRPLGVVEVDDDGPGIPPELRERVFDPFFTGGGSTRGTGLGLAVARRIATDHGGTLEAVDPPDDERVPWSTRMRLTVPALSGARRADAHA